MTKLTLLLMSICFVAVVECTGVYYWPMTDSSQGIYAVPQFAPVPQFGVWPPVENCDKKEDMEEGSKEGSSSESSSSESSSSESSSSESGESKESGEKEGEGEGSKEESKSSSEEEEGSSSSEEGEKKEEGGEESGEGKEEPKKKKKKEEKESNPVFPTYIFPPRPAAVYAPSSAYNILPYRSSYVLRPATTYGAKSTYQYVLPASSSVLGGYNSPLTYSRVISSPVAKYAYSASAFGYPTVAKTYISSAPSASLYSVPATSLMYIKK